MKCPYRTVKNIVKYKYDSCYGKRENEIREDFPECYGDKCPLYTDDECVRARIEKGDYYE